jgi:class 3 adenylate cyclase
MERKWVVVAFGDLAGFGPWTSRAASSREVKDPFILKFYAVMQHYVRKHPNVHFKYTGDGFMVLKEFTPGRCKKEIVEFLLTLRCITRKAKRAVKECRWPPPDRFRIRISSGDVYKLMVLDPNDPQRKRLIPEYIEYATNTASHLLEVNPEITCLATEGVVDAMGEKGSLFGVRKLVSPSCYPKSVNREDIGGLKILRF